MRSRINAIIVAVALIVLGAAVAAVSLHEAGWDFSRLSTEKLEEHIYPVEEAFQSIDVHVTTSDVYVFPAPDDTCRIHTYEQELMPVRVEVVDGCLRILQEDNRKWSDRVMISGGPNSRVEVALPGEVYDSLKIEMTTGDVTVSETLRFRTVNMGLTTGDVDCKAQIAELLDIHGTTGDIRIAAGTSDAAVIIRLTTGDVFVRDTVCRSMEIETTTGTIQLKLCDAETILSETTTGDITGMLLSGKTFRVHTTTGDVDVPTNGNGGICELQTTTGDIRVQITKAAGK